VTHDIDEAVVLGSRVVVLQAAPSRITDDLPVPIPRPATGAASVVATACREREALAAAHAL
jgi:ABC-type nitrate/sulfonate/bicarbonate transport system ATPase subunit